MKYSTKTSRYLSLDSLSPKVFNLTVTSFKPKALITEVPKAITSASINGEALPKASTPNCENWRYLPLWLL